MATERHPQSWPLYPLEPWPPDDTEESVLGTDLHQTTITYLRWAIHEAEQADLNFYTHELREYVRYRALGNVTGQPASTDAAYVLWNNVHTATLEDYGLTDGALYHPSAVGLTP